MDTGNVTRVITRTEKLSKEISQGRASEEILRTLDPILEARLGTLLDQFEHTAPEIGPLLDLRAKISEAWRLRRELKNAVKLGKSSEGILEAMVTNLKTTLAKQSKED